MKTLAISAVLKQNFEPQKPIHLLITDNSPLVGDSLVGISMLFAEGKHSHCYTVNSVISNEEVRFCYDLGSNTFFVKTTERQYFVMVISSDANDCIPGENSPALAYSWIRPRPSNVNNNWRLDAKAFYLTKGGVEQTKYLLLSKVTEVEEICPTCFLISGVYYDTTGINIFDRSATPREVTVTYIVFLPFENR